MLWQITGVMNQKERMLKEEKNRYNQLGFHY